MKPFVFYWQNFSLSYGVKFIIGVIILLIVSKFVEFPWFVVGISSLLAWIIDIMGTGRNRVGVILAYVVIGSVLTWFSNMLGEEYWPWLTFLFVVSFVGTLLLRYGSHLFMLGWSTIYWFLLMPTLYTLGSHQELMLSHLLGSGVVFGLVIIHALWSSRRKKDSQDVEEEQIEQLVPWKVTIPYALVVSLTVVACLLIGDHLLTSDKTMIANSTFMIIGFSMVNTWKAGLERMIAALIAIVGGFYLGVLIQSESFSLIFFLIMSFFVAACLKVNNGAVVFCFIIPMAYGWGIMEYETGNAIANERIMAEFAGIAMAGVAITLLDYTTRLYKTLRA